MDSIQEKRLKEAVEKINVFSEAITDSNKESVRKLLAAFAAGVIHACPQAGGYTDQWDDKSEEALWDLVSRILPVQQPVKPADCCCNRCGAALRFNHEVGRHECDACHEGLNG